MKKLFIILFILFFASLKAQMHDSKQMLCFPYGFFTAEQNLRAEEKERQRLVENNVKEIILKDSAGTTVETFTFDKNGRCTGRKINSGGVTEFIFEYNTAGDIIKIITMYDGKTFSSSVISYKDGLPVSSINDSDIKYSDINTYAEYENGKLLVLKIKDKAGTESFRLIPAQNGDTLYLKFDIPETNAKNKRNTKDKKVKEDSEYKSSEMTDTLNIGENTYEKQEEDNEALNEKPKELRAYSIISKKDTVITIEGFMQMAAKFIYKNDKLIKTEIESENSGIITTEFFYTGNGLIDYKYTTQQRGKSQGRVNFSYTFFDN
jgi:hypothetical protein